MIKPFAPSTLSQITPHLILTDVDGVEYGTRNGHWFRINTASELYANAEIKIPVPVFESEEVVIARLDMLADIIKKELDNDITGKKQVVVFCAMGMERSPLAVAWYLAKYEDYTLGSAYKHIHSIRPIVLDRSWWSGIDIDEGLDDALSWKLVDTHNSFIIE